MPGPSSTTRQPRPAVAAVRPTVTVVPAGVCVRALASRLVSTWVSRERVAGDDDRLVGQVELPAVVRPRRVRVADRVEDQPGQVDVAAFQRPAGVQPGQQQQVLDQRGHPLGLRRDPGERVLGRPARAVARRRQLGVAADRGQRGAQLVAGVGDELAQPRLAVLAGLQAPPTLSSIRFSAVPTWPTSVRGSTSGTRSASSTSPRSSGSALTLAAVSATRSSGRSSRRTSTAPAMPPPSSASAIAIDLDDDEPADDVLGPARGLADDVDRLAGTRVATSR